MNIVEQTRRELKLSQEEFGKKLHYSRKAIGQIENGKQKITTELLERIAETFDLKLQLSFRKTYKRPVPYQNDEEKQIYEKGWAFVREWILSQKHKRLTYADINREMKRLFFHHKGRVGDLFWKGAMDSIRKVDGKYDERAMLTCNDDECRNILVFSAPFSWLHSTYGEEAEVLLENTDYEDNDRVFSKAMDDKVLLSFCEVQTEEHCECSQCQNQEWDLCLLSNFS